MLGDLQEVINTRILVEESYLSYGWCCAAFLELEEGHNQRSSPLWKSWSFITLSSW